MASYFFDVKSAKPGTAADSLAYANRTGRYARSKETNDLVATGFQNLPDGFDNDPMKFLAAGDKYERCNGSVVRKITLALPRELDTKKQVEVAVKFLNTAFPGKPAGFAIHCPKCALGEGENPHMHAWICDRVPDGIPRSKEGFFKRAHPTIPELGGCRKKSGGNDRTAISDALKNVRRIGAEVQNEALEAGGHAARVSHLSLREQKIQRVPEPHFGYVALKKMAKGEKDAIRASRG